MPEFSYGIQVCAPPPSDPPQISSIHHRHHLNFDQLLGFAEFQNGKVRRGRPVVIRSEIRVDDRVRSPDVSHTWPRPEDKNVDNIGEGCSCGFQRLLDSVHTCPGLRLQVIGHMFEQVLTAVGVIMVNGQGRAACQPQKFATFDFDGGHEWHEDISVMVRMVDYLHVSVRHSENLLISFFSMSNVRCRMYDFQMYLTQRPDYPFSQ